MNTPPPHAGSETAQRSIPEPRWLVLTVAIVAFAVLFAFAISPRSALFWYVFPLFGVGGCYLVQFRSEFPARWKLALAASGVLSAVALALEWPFSGHVLWNVLFIGHAWMTGKGRTSWMVLMLVSLLHLLAMKIAFQTARDVAGAVVSITVAAIALFVLEGRRFRREA